MKWIDLDELMKSDTKRIEEMADKLVEKICAYSRSQKQTWRKIPYIALQAHARHYGSGFYEPNKKLNHYDDSTLRNCFMGGCWLIGDRRDPKWGFVDLATGELDLYRKERVLALAFHLDELNPKRIISNMESICRVYDVQKYQLILDKMAKKYKVDKLYKRKKP